MEPRHGVSVITAAYTSLYHQLRLLVRLRRHLGQLILKITTGIAPSIKAPLGAPGFYISVPREISVGAKTAVADSALIDSGTVYPQSRVFRALANIKGNVLLKKLYTSVPGTKRAAGVFVRKLQP
jgi:hypothetical protein